MQPVEIMKDGSWVRIEGLHEVKKGDEFRVIGPNKEAGNPHVAKSDAVLKPHPRRGSIKVWCVDSVYEPIPRL